MTGTTDSSSLDVQGLVVRRGDRRDTSRFVIKCFHQVRQWAHRSEWVPGKTTLLRAIVGVQIVLRGTVTVLGKPTGSNSLRRSVGYSTQQPAVYRGPHRQREPELLLSSPGGGKVRRGSRSGANEHPPPRRAAVFVALWRRTVAIQSRGRAARHAEGPDPRRADCRLSTRCYETISGACFTSWRRRVSPC